MANLRLISVTVLDETNIVAKFTENLNENIEISNVSLMSQTPGVLDPLVLEVNVVQDQLNITTRPLTPLAAYFITFASTPDQLFASINGDAIILNDGITNRQLILAPLESINPIQEYLTNFYRNNVYDLESPSFISSYIQGLSTVLSTVLYDIGQSKNENYLSFTVTDEVKTRGPGAFDRLNEEGAYEVLRVGTAPTNASVNSITNISSFPDYPVSLLSTNNIEDLTVNSLDAIQTFNINTLTLNVSKSPVIALNSLTIVYSSSLDPYVYNIDNLGYQLLDSTYDPEFAFTYLQLEQNQIRLNDKILNDPLFSTENIFMVQVNYQYKDNGKIIDPSSLIIDTILPSGREATPTIENIFTLGHAPIVTVNDLIGSLGSIVFIDPNAFPGSGTPHPAFLYEIPFRLDYLPSRVGEYSVDYSTGNVYVFGASSVRDGTGPFPPIATYLYRFVFKSEIDYVYQSDTADLVSLPNGSLTESNTNIAYNSEQVLVQDVDYNSDTHIETLNERIDNRLLALNAIQPLNFPITDVFRILNETTGEIYKTIRWTDSKIFFNYVKPPNVVSDVGERASFQDVLNELLFVSSQIVDGSNVIFKIFLNNNNIIAQSEDSTGSSVNTSVNFSNTSIFVQEIYFESSISIDINNQRLQNIGDYQIDYVNGIVWCLVSSSQSISIGSVSYKRGYIAPENPHVITVDNIYYQLSALGQKTKIFDYVSFSDGSILPKTIDVSDENFLMSNTTLPYQILSSQIGAFVDATFTPGVTNSINFIRGLYEYEDLLNNRLPINFALSSTPNGMTIEVDPLEFQEYHSVGFDGTNFFVLANTNLLYQSPNITMNISIVRLSDSKQLWNSSGTIGLGSPFKFILPGINSPVNGDAVNVVYSYTINNLSRIVIDYNKGDYYIDYSYLADEIIISYEYGDNVLDFRQSAALNNGDTYYVSYKAGALRDALLANFGTLINIPILNSLDVGFERERYRDALMAAMQSFTAGPTVTSIKNIVNTIVHTPPQITESAFTNWSLGSSLLNPEPIQTTGIFALAPAKFDNGVVVDQPNQSIKFPVSSNLRLEQGALESWVIPDWDGLDNQSDLFISISKNNIPLPVEQIFIGPSAYHPTYLDGYVSSFKVNTKDQVFGIPNQSMDGVFVFYSADESEAFNRWYIFAVDGYGDGYGVKNYKINVKTNGKFYDVKTSDISSTADKISSGTNSFTYMISGLSRVNNGITFIADNQHFLFDFGKEENSNRFSIFKDESGYLNFRIIDKNKNYYTVSSDISSWSAGEQHHVATSWAINTKNARDEMHLFIDGFEVPNIIKYNSFVSPYVHEKFRTVDPEEVIGVITRPIIASTDLITTAGSANVFSLIDFTAYGILAGDTLFIEETGFTPTGYVISVVNGQTLTLSAPLSITSTNSTYSINKITFDVELEIDMYPNIAVSLLHESAFGIDLQTMQNSASVISPSSNFNSIGVQPGYILRINEVGLEPTYTIIGVSNHTLTLSDEVSATFGSAPFFIYPNDEQEIPGVRALHPAYEILRNNAAPELTIRDQAKENDIVLIRTLGLNHKFIDKKYYLWNGVGNTGTVNTIMTKLPPPIQLSEVNITHILLDGYNIGPSNSTLSGGIFTSGHITTDQPSLSDDGRSLSVNIAGSNVDFTTSVSVTIHGTIGGSSSSEILTFTENETLITVNMFSAVQYIIVTCKPIDPTKNCLVIEIEESAPITSVEGGTTFPVIRFSYQVFAGNTLSGSGNTITDPNGWFSIEDINNYLVISSPSPVAGQYQILDVSADHLSATIFGSLSSFTNGVYQVLNTNTFSSGLQNGFFTFELADGYVGRPYNLVQGLYRFEYHSYLSMQFDVDRLYGFVGSDINIHNHFNGIIDDFQIVSEMLTDTRIGETAQVNQETITKDFNSLVALKPSSSTLMLLDFDTFPFSNSANIYTIADSNFIQSSASVSDNFEKSIYITNTPVIVDNTGILNTKKQGTIEFWVSPLFDTWNDPNYRFYFDATAMVSEKIISTNNATVQVSGRVSSILSIKLQVGNQNIDYFGGGKIDADAQTIYLNKALPSQQTPVVVNYMPTGTNGDRISIYKDSSGYINFDVRASGTDYQVRSPAFWVKNSWHRLKAQYVFNTGLGSDQIKFFIDGYERGNILFGNNLLFGQGQVYGSSFVGQNRIQSSIIFKDTVNELFIGSDFTGANNAFASFDNIRISDISRPLFLPFGESMDVNYSSNLNIVFPVQDDLFTTLLLDFDSLVELNTNFSTLKNRKTGLFDFTVNIFDSFDIVKDSAVVKQVLEELINTLKPANSRVFITYD